LNVSGLTRRLYDPTASWAGSYLKDEKKNQPKLAWETFWLKAIPKLQTPMVFFNFSLKNYRKGYLN